jgi:periplasmic protein TonB
MPGGEELGIGRCSVTIFGERKKMRGIGVWSALLILVSAEASAADYIGEFGGWEVGRAEDGCLAQMEYEGPGATQVTVKKFVTNNFRVLVTNYNWSARQDEAYQVTFWLNGTDYSGNVLGARGSGRSGFVAKFDNDLEGDFTKGSSLHIYLDDQQIDQLSLEGTAVAMQAVNRCLVKVRTEMTAAERERSRYAHLPTDPFASTGAGVAPPATRTAASPAQPRDMNSWMGRIQNDYPSAALRAEASGTVSFLATVSPNGRALRCQVTGSSGHAALDEAACRGMTRYARFNPAIGEEGNPIEGEWSGTLRYVLPN